MNYPYKVGQKIKCLDLPQIQGCYKINEIDTSGIYIILEKLRIHLIFSNIEPYFKIGDRIRILNKSIHCNLYKCKYNVENIDYINHIWDKGSISLKKYDYYSFAAKDLEWMPKQEEGEVKMKKNDKVRIIGKTFGAKLEKTPFKINDIIKITDNYQADSFGILGWGFNKQDLELVKEEKKEMKKYTLIKSFNAKDIKYAQSRNGNCSEFKDEYIKFLEIYGDNTIYKSMFNQFIRNATEKQIEFCIQHGFIKEKEEKKYKIETELTEDEFRYLMSHLNMCDSGFKNAMEMGSNSYNYDYKDKSDKIQMNVFIKFKNIFLSHLNM